MIVKNAWRIYFPQMHALLVSSISLRSPVICGRPFRLASRLESLIRGSPEVGVGHPRAAPTPLLGCMHQGVWMFAFDDPHLRIDERLQQAAAAAWLSCRSCGCEIHLRLGLAMAARVEKAGRISDCPWEADDCSSIHIRLTEYCCFLFIVMAQVSILSPALRLLSHAAESFWGTRPIMSPHA